MNLILLSGGVDSAVLLWQQTAVGHCAAMFIDYGQEARSSEYAAAKELCSLRGVRLYRQAMPEMVSDGVVIHGRNFALIAAAIPVAMTVGASSIMIGANMDDSEMFPDCRSTWIESISKSCRDAYKVKVVAPLVGMTKEHIVSISREMGVPLALTFSCYVPDSQGNACGECLACTTRADALK
jgi:7-cyano-7-deazaguanine synthase